MPTSKEESKKENEHEIEEQEKADPGTTSGTDPQEHMKGPVSSLMKKIEETFEGEETDKRDK